MHLLAISLLAILAGTLLLAKFRKEAAGKFFMFISWFFVIVGFVLFIGFIGGGICRMAHHCCDGKAKCGQEMMMGKECSTGMMMNKECGPGMMHHGMCCPPPCMEKGMCCKMMGCMKSDSMMKCSPEGSMKCCPKDMKCDSAKCPVKK